VSRGVAALAIIIAAGIAVLQSTVLRFANIAGVHPDLVLIVIVYVANKNGPMIGQLAGLGAGIILDVMGLSPLGLYALVYAVIGAVFGTTKGKMFVDPIFMPVLFAIVAVLAKGILGSAFAGLYGIRGVVDGVFSTSFLIELGYTAVVSPVLFALLNLVGPLRPERRRGEGL
jgi:rod shape-determining protein MreD